MAKQTAEGFVEDAKRKRAAFIARIKAQEELAARDPKRYQAKVRRLAYIGYAYLILIALATLAAIVGTVLLLIFGHIGAILIKLLFVLVPLLFVLLRSLWVK